MIKRSLIINVALIIALIISPLVVYAEPCTAQGYTDPKNPPDFNCPGPDEDQLVYPKAKPAQKTVALKKGDKAPADGILMHRDKAQRLGSRITALRRIRWNDISELTEKYEADLALQKALSKGNLEMAKAQRASYKEQLAVVTEDLRSANKWYKSFAFGLVVGIVVTAGAATGIALGVK